VHLLVAGIAPDGRIKNTLQPIAGSCQRRHYGADGNRSNGRNLLVRTAFEFAQDQDFPERFGEFLQRAGKLFAVAAGQRARHIDPGAAQIDGAILVVSAVDGCDTMLLRTTDRLSSAAKLAW